MGSDQVWVAGMKYISILATCPPERPYCMSGLRSPPKLMMPARTTEVIRKTRRRSRMTYQKSVLLIDAPPPGQAIGAEYLAEETGSPTQVDRCLRRFFPWPPVRN